MTAPLVLVQSALREASRTATSREEFLATIDLLMRRMIAELTVEETNELFCHLIASFPEYT